MRVNRVDPWSVMRFSLAVSLVLFVVAIVLAMGVYLLLDAAGVIDSVSRSLAEITSGSGGSGAQPFTITAKGVIGVTALLGACGVVLVTALMTLGAFVHNVCAEIVGGVALTLSERE